MRYKEEGNWVLLLIDMLKEENDITLGGEADMSKQEKDLLDYIVVCISEFASRYRMHMRDAYIYLNRYKGIEFLKEFYDVEHTLSFDDAVEDLTVICRKNGGAVL